MLQVVFVGVQNLQEVLDVFDHVDDLGLCKGPVQIEELELSFEVELLEGHDLEGDQNR